MQGRILSANIWVVKTKKSGDKVTKEETDVAFRQKLIILLQELLEIDTQNPPGRERALVQYIIAKLGLRKEQYEIIPHSENRASLVVSVPGESKDTILFLGHLDTVPCGNKDRWRYPPIAGTQVGDRIYGLGASDMKSGLAVLLTVLQQVLCREKPLRQSLLFVFTADEESHCAGAKAVAGSKWMKHVKAVFLSEPTNGKTVLAEKGVLWILLKIQGRQAHGAMPEEALNGNEFLWKTIEMIQEEIRQLEASRLLGAASVSTTIFQGGFKSNIIPETAEAVLDIRTVCPSNHEQIRDCLKRMKWQLKKQYDVQLWFEITNEKMVLEETTDTPFIGKWLSLSKEPDEPMGIPYYTDLAELLRKHSCEFVICGPGTIEKMHKVDESVEITELEQTARKYLKFIEQYG